MATVLNPLKNITVSKHQIGAFRMTPNTSIQHKPLFIYHGAFQPSTSPSQIEAHLTETGIVTPRWRYTMYTRSHFHSSTHEVLCIYSGSARLCFGCEGNAERVEPVVEKGDVIVVPAGVAHRLLEDRTGDFTMVGAYPIGKQWDMCYGVTGEREKIKCIEGLGWFQGDPIYGDDGPVLDI